MGMFVYLFGFLVWVCHVSNATGSNFTLEFEHAVERKNQNFRAMWRSNASKKKTLLLYEGDYVVLDFCLSSQTAVDITDLKFSNDGASDNVTFFIDGIPIGSFETFALSDWGRMWNVFQDSGPIGKSVTIHPGNHELNISVSVSDNYGVEFDSLQFTLDNEVTTKEIFLCQQELKEHVMFNNIYTPVSHESNGVPTSLIQKSFDSDCLDETNVQICFNTSNWIGVQFYATSEYLNNTGLGDEWENAILNAKTCYESEGNVWKIGIANDQNEEFGMADSITKDYQFTIPKVLENLKVIPREISDPKDKSFEITFKIEQKLLDMYPWLLFSMGAVEPENVQVSVQFYDYRTTQMIPWKDTKTLSFNKEKESWYIPSAALSSSLDNIIRLTFESSKPIAFDFMRLDVEERSRNESSVPIFENRYMKLRGGKNMFTDHRDMQVVTADGPMEQGIDRVSIMARKGRRAAFAKIMTLHSDGRFFLHTLAERRHFMDLFPKSISEASGFYLRPHRGSGDKVYIKQVDVDPDSLVLNITYEDSSQVMFRFSFTGDETKLCIFDIWLAPGALDTFGCYFSKAHKNTMAAVDDLIIDKKSTYKVLNQSINGLTGTQFAFDHEFAPWYVGVGSDLVAEF